MLALRKIPARAAVQVRRHRADSNQREIVRHFTACGGTWQPILSAGGRREGCPDGLAGYRGRTLLVEVKRPGEGLRETQGEWAAWWRGAPPVTVWTLGDLLRAFGLEGGD